MYCNNLQLNLKRGSVTPAMEPWRAESKHVVAHVSIYNQTLGKKKKKAKQKACAVTQNCQMTVALRPETGGNYTRGEKNWLAEVISRKLSIHIHKAPTNLRE